MVHFQAHGWVCSWILAISKGTFVSIRPEWQILNVLILPNCAQILTSLFWTPLLLVYLNSHCHPCLQQQLHPFTSSSTQSSITEIVYTSISTPNSPAAENQYLSAGPIISIVVGIVLAISMLFGFVLYQKRARRGENRPPFRRVNSHESIELENSPKSLLAYTLVS